MRRTLTLLALPIVVGLGLFTAGGASADVVNVGALTKEVPVTAAVNVANRDLQYTFQGSNTLDSTIDVTASNWGSGSAQLELYLPDGTFFTFCTLTTAPTYCPFVPTVTGTWKLRINPIGNATGSATFKYATQQQKGALTSGKPATTTINAKGQNARWTYAGTAGVPITFNVTATNWGTGGSARLYFYPPSGGLYDWCEIAGTTKQCTIYPDRPGTWRMVVQPLDIATGSTTFVYAQDQSKGTLAMNTPSTTAVAIPYQNAKYSFTGTAGQHVSLDVTATDWGTTGTANVYVYMPDGTLYLNCVLAKTPTFCDFTPNTPGTWKLGIDPQGAAVGSATMNLVADQDKGALVVNTPVTTTINSKGQNATFTIQANAGDVTTLNVTGSNWGGGTARLYFFPPSGSPLWDHCDLTAATTTCTFYPNSTGAWKMSLDPQAGATGTATIKRTS